MDGNYKPSEKEKHELLLKFGFEQVSCYDKETDKTFYKYGHYQHNLIPGISFDFSANSIEGIIQAIYKIGYHHGKQEKLKEIQSALGIEGGDHV